MQLNHKSKIYEVQVRQEHTMSWKPKSHHDDIVDAATAESTLRTNGSATRILNRANGMRSLKVVGACRKCGDELENGDNIKDLICGGCI